MWTKICGIRDVSTALAVANLGPQAIGLNFFEGSPRVIEVEVAAEIVRRLPERVEPVGLFVNHSLADIRSICGACGISLIQLHGDEPPEFLAELSEFRIVKAFRIGESGLGEVGDYLEQCRMLGTRPWACLADAKVPGSYGGTGRVAPWEILRDQWNADWPPLILAGGLTPRNVADGIRAVHPWGVDVAGGVELSLGQKDLSLVQEFLQRTSSKPSD